MSKFDQIRQRQTTQRVESLAALHPATEPGVYDLPHVPWLVRSPRYLTPIQVQQLPLLHPVILVESAGSLRMIAGHRTLQLVRAVDPSAEIPVTVLDAGIDQIAQLGFADLVLTPLVFGTRSGKSILNNVLTISAGHLRGIEGTEWAEPLAAIATPNILAKKALERLCGIQL